MRWFEGSIPAAIASAKQLRCVFVVVITGDDDQSTQLMSSWEADSVSGAAHNCCVAIRLDAQSETCVQFSQIYPVVCIPSCFFIGENGVPLEVIAGSVTAEELTQRINKVRQNVLKKEVDRWKLGKEVLDYKRKQEEEKTKRLLEERNREKAEERAARERVKQQIALDRADRATRYSQVQQEAEAARLTALQARAAEDEAKREATHRERSAVARIQFRLPDGSSFTNQFPSETRLQEARRFVVQEVGNRYGHFSLATMFPRREFTAEDLVRSLLELELAPSASIVLLPQSSRASNTVIHSSEGGGIWVVLGSLLFPLLAVWRFITSFLFRTPPPPASPRPQNQHTPSSGSSSEPKRDAVRKRVLEKRPEDFKKDGKIYRLRTQEDSEDDNNTWNGNSTQQM
ncbi:UBX domain-containing protein 4 isoform X2 [Triplophysa rosa]|uniref:UBX domain-containing protein 4 isoform X2 n=1 Tax=Triplophysa rosa TaxID=992332 RepID=UPI0025461F28|nr:UBX domain-containing protein 4 isoform X2 [Triplophysa rosa]